MEIVHRLSEAELMLKEKELNNIKINTALELANQRRRAAKLVSDEMMINPLAKPSSSSTIQSLQAEVAELHTKLKLEELQRTTLSMLFLNQEDTYKKEIKKQK